MLPKSVLIDLKFLPGKREDNSKSLDFVYVPSHLHHMCFELLKNAMRATMERNGSGDNIPYIRALMCVGNEDLTIKVNLV